MKKTIITFVCAIWACALFAQKNNTPYNFPVKPGSEEWNKFTSVDEMYKTCQIPDDILNNLTTPALLKTCLNYPVSSILLLQNTPQEGFDSWKEHFNGVAELLK